MNISSPFILRPVMTTLLTVAVILAGALGYASLAVDALPNVDFPTIQVTANLPGASPETMASSVATPLEKQFTAIPGLEKVSSTSALGTTSITLEFALDRGLPRHRFGHGRFGQRGDLRAQRLVQRLADDVVATQAELLLGVGIDADNATFGHAEHVQAGRQVLHQEVKELPARPLFLSRAIVVGAAAEMLQQQRSRHGHHRGQREPAGEIGRAGQGQAGRKRSQAEQQA